VLGGIEGMLKSFTAELRPVRVNGVCAGAVDTGTIACTRPKDYPN
jgi:NAD(P)-dependent dehydrogenase (short-subunit alcohol dehydrogenase family)